MPAESHRPRRAEAGRAGADSVRCPSRVLSTVIVGCDTGTWSAKHQDGEGASDSSCGRTRRCVGAHRDVRPSEEPQVIFTALFQQGVETRQGRSAHSASLTHSRPCPPKRLRNRIDGPVCPRDRATPCVPGRRPSSGSPRRQLQLHDPHSLRDVRRRSPAARSSSRHGDPARTPRTRSSATSASALVAEIGADSVSERVTERKSAKRTRTVIVRPARDLARSRGPKRSAMMERRFEHASIAGCRPSADCAPAERARRCVWICRELRFHASAVNFFPPRAQAIVPRTQELTN